MHILTSEAHYGCNRGPWIVEIYADGTARMLTDMGFNLGSHLRSVLEELPEVSPLGHGASPTHVTPEALFPRGPDTAGDAWEPGRWGLGVLARGGGSTSLHRTPTWYAKLPPTAGAAKANRPPTLGVHNLVALSRGIRTMVAGPAAISCTAEEAGAQRAE